MILSGDNARLLEDLYERYTKEPGQLSPQWKLFFENLERGSNGFAHPGPARTATPKEIGVQMLIEAYRRQGHLAADLDPLGLAARTRELLDLSLYGLSTADFDTTFDSQISDLGVSTLRKIIEFLEQTYCSTIASEHFYLRSNEQRNWLQDRMESVETRRAFDAGLKLRIFEKVYQAHYFEKFLAQKYVGKKRFSLEGGETFAALMDMVVEEAGAHRMDGLVIGMAHRGRLNMLVNVLEKPAGLIFAEFDENFDPDSLDYADVKYHLGFSNQRMTRAGKEVHLSLAFNPSHLEAVDPVILGSVRARQEMWKDVERRKWMPVMVHGDAAFVGQGVVAESLNLMSLPAHTVGGTLHVIINNQIGFTTLPSESRSTHYCTDLAKGFQLPIFHANADDPEAVVRVVKMAMEFRQKFLCDVVIDLVCYRRLGHNETDEPAFTQPQMYELIRKHPPTADVYEARLRKDADISAEDIDFIKNGVEQGLEDSFRRAKDKNMRMSVDTMNGVWSLFTREPLDSEPQTSLLADQMSRIIQTLTTVPEGFTPHPKLVRLLSQRAAMFAGTQPIDWGLAEALAFGSILENGLNIRLTGQDSQRGTFSHRHAVLVDVNDGRKWVPLNHISDTQGNLQVWNSALSEYAVLGFEYGYSLADPRSLVIWEAQFGDFANGAQIIIDQFITSSEVKWHRMSGLVMLLPHGYEGQGPEHSSARLERFLQLCAHDNIQVCNCTTPAQYFHLLRRQILRSYRKPLIIMSPKSLLRLPEAGSNLEDLSLGIFREVLHDRTIADTRKVKRLVFCSGKIYYDLLASRKERQMEDRVALLRIEQLYPFPVQEVDEVLALYDKATELFWVQEEPENQGSAWFIAINLFTRIKDRVKTTIVARPLSASPAAGMMKVHKKELEELMRRTFA